MLDTCMITAVVVTFATSTELVLRLLLVVVIVVVEREVSVDIAVLAPDKVVVEDDTSSVVLVMVADVAEMYVGSIVLVTDVPVGMIVGKINIALS